MTAIDPEVMARHVAQSRGDFGMARSADFHSLLTPKIRSSIDFALEKPNQSLLKITMPSARIELKA